MMGLWSELLVLSIADKIDDWATAWHEHPRSTFDFRFQETGLDVKSFGGDNREHFFKINQLRNLGVKNCFIVSMCLKGRRNATTFEQCMYLQYTCKRYNKKGSLHLLT